jgi:DNA-binding beta-propeller fold protein YncE
MEFTNRILIRGMLLLVPLLFTACGGGGSSDGSGGSSGTPTTSSPAASTNPPASGAFTPAPTGTARSYAYVADDSSSTATGYSIDPTTGALTELGSAGAGRSLPNNVMAHASGKFVYLSNDDGVTAFGIDPATGAATQLGTTDPAGAWPMQAAIDPGGDFLYMGKNYAVDGGPPVGLPELSTYRIDSGTGELAPASTVMTGKFIAAIKVSSKAHVAYVSIDARPPDYGSSTRAYGIDPATGSLTLLAETAANGRLAVHPEGKYVYLAGAGQISVHRLDSQAGTLTQVGVALPSGAPNAVAVHPSGNFVYVANGQEVWTYRFDATTGALISSAGPMPVTDGPHPGLFRIGADPVAFDPSGKFAYVCGVSSVLVYSVDLATGAWTLVGTSTPRSRAAVSIAIASVVDPSSGQ